MFLEFSEKLQLEPLKQHACIYKHCSEAHLHRYLAELDFRYSNRERRGIDDVSRAEIALMGVEGKRLTYKNPARKLPPNQKTRWWRAWARLPAEDPQLAFFFIISMTTVRLVRPN